MARAACAALRNLAYAGSVAEVGREVTHTGCLPQMMAALSVHLEDAAVQQAGLAALACLPAPATHAILA